MTPFGPNDFLSPLELKALTGKARGYMHAAALAKLGLPFTFNGREVRLLRSVALAHELMPESTLHRGPDLSKVR